MRVVIPTIALQALLALLVVGLTTGSTAAQKQPYAPSLRINVDNDYFNISMRGTDRYYSYGLTLGLSSNVGKPCVMDRLMVAPANPDARLRTFYLDNRFQTPHHIGNPDVQVGDYPYVSLLTFNYSNRSFKGDDLSIYSTFTIGMQGPITQGEQIQTYLHRHIIHSNVPLGWKYQLPNDLAAGYGIGVEKGVLNAPNVEALLLAEINLGTLYNNLKLGGTVRIGRFATYFSPDAWLFRRGKNAAKSQLVLSLTPYIKMVQGNSLLEGGPFKTAGRAWGEVGCNYYHIDRKDLERIVAGYSWTFSYTNRWMTFYYSENLYTAEIKGLNGHVYGTMGLAFRL